MARINALNIIRKGKSYTGHLFKKWFGIKPSDAPEPWNTVLTNMTSAMESVHFTIALYGSECEESIYAYTYYGSDIIYVCDAYFSAKDTGYDSKKSVVVHELSHAVGNTKDWFYG